MGDFLLQNARTCEPREKLSEPGANGSEQIALGLVANCEILEP